jgi:glucose/arabinose dehydrogenase
LIILEDTNNDGKADKQTTFAGDLHIPVGFEIAAEGVYVSQGNNLVLLVDENGDDKADRKEVLLSGFDDHDTHHAISAFAADESGAIYMAEGVFLHTNVETSYGPVRGTNGGFYRYEPKRHKLERVNQVSIPNPWGIAFDRWGQNFYAETSGPNVNWMLPGSTLPRYGNGNFKGPNLIEKDHMVRPTSGLEFIASRHFPDEVQGDLIINNTIGFLGTKQHQLLEDTVGFTSKWRQDLIVSSDRNFRPVDMEIAPDGSLYVADWHNILIGHMQHNARDPLRDHVHGRIYRVTYPSKPLVTPAKIHGESIPKLLDN